MPIDTKLITLSDGIPRKFRLTWGAVERVAQSTGLDLLEVEKPGVLMRYLSHVVHAGLVDRDKITVEQVGDLIALEDAQRIFNEAVAVTPPGSKENPTAPAGVIGSLSAEPGPSAGMTSD